MSTIPPLADQPANWIAAAYEDWPLDKSIAFLKEQGVAIKDSATLPEIQKQVAAHADAAAKVRVSETAICELVLTRNEVGCGLCWSRPGLL